MLHRSSLFCSRAGLRASTTWLFKTSCAALLLTGARAACDAQRAYAHIAMEGVLQGRGGDQKVAPCEGAPRSATPYVFEPGATIALSVLEGIPHDGYFRISFDNDGTDFKDPQSIAPINPDRYGPGQKCQNTPADHCGESDFCNMTSDGNGPTVLWDRLEPHLGTSVSFGQVRTWNVKLPNVECENCTLQVMQVMEDPAGDAHGPFDGTNDLYYRCLDIVLKKGAGSTPGTVTAPATNDGIECAKELASSGDELAPSSDDDGGCSVAHDVDKGAPAIMALFVTALFLRRRRRVR